MKTKNGGYGWIRQFRRDDVHGCTNVAEDRDVESDSKLSQLKKWWLRVDSNHRPHHYE